MRAEWDGRFGRQERLSGCGKSGASAGQGSELRSGTQHKPRGDRIDTGVLAPSRYVRRHVRTAHGGQRMI